MSRSEGRQEQEEKCKNVYFLRVSSDKHTNIDTIDKRIGHQALDHTCL